MRRSTRHDIALDQHSNIHKTSPKTTLSGFEETPNTIELTHRKSPNHCQPGGLDTHQSPRSEHNDEEEEDADNFPAQEESFNVWQVKSLFDWLRRPYLIGAENSNVQLARTIDHVSKTVFTLLFFLFSFFYFLTYAVIKPAQLEDWIENEFEAVD